MNNLPFALLTIPDCIDAHTIDEDKVPVSIRFAPPPDFPLIAQEVKNHLHHGDLSVVYALGDLVPEPIAPLKITSVQGYKEVLGQSRVFTEREEI